MAIFPKKLGRLPFSDNVYLYLPRLADPQVLLGAIRNGVALIMWPSDSFAFADSFDEAAGRYRGLRGGQNITLTDPDAPGLVVKPDVARKQFDAEVPAAAVGGHPAPPAGTGRATPPGTVPPPLAPTQPKRFHGTVALDPARVGRDASRIADEVIAHLAGLVSAEVRVTLEIDAEIPTGAPDQVVRTVTENSRTLKFTTSGFEQE